MPDEKNEGAPKPTLRVLRGWKNEYNVDLERLRLEFNLRTEDEARIDAVRNGLAKDEGNPNLTAAEALNALIIWALKQLTEIENDHRQA